MKFFCKYLIISILIIFSFSAKAFELSPKAQISVITGAPGPEMYMLFGHSAIRVYDPLFGLDIQYNYGTFDFDTPNFEVRFARGQLPYSLSKEDFPRFLAFYAQGGRSVYEQVLNLNTEERQKLFNFLENNAKPENRYYRYDFFYDNCSTRVRDVLAKALPGKIIFDQTPAKDTKTFRDLIAPYLQEPWLNLGINLILGLPADKVATSYDYMFLPDRMLNALEQTKIKRGEQVSALSSKTFTVNEGMFSRPVVGFWSPAVVFSSFFVLIALWTYWDFRSKKVSYSLDFILFLVSGGIGIFFLLMWFGTEHKAVKTNLNILWAFPLNFPIAFFLLFKRKADFLKNYFLYLSILLALTILAWAILPQRLPLVMIPVALVLLMRSALIYNKLRKSRHHYKQK